VHPVCVPSSKAEPALLPIGNTSHASKDAGQQWLCEVSCVIPVPVYINAAVVIVAGLPVLPSHGELSLPAQL